MKIGILQPSYLPWLGFFEQMIKCDIFVYLDDVQYTKNDWRNRNRIKTMDSFQWLTVPVSYKFGQKIREVTINNTYPWKRKQINALRTWYNKSRYYNDYIEDVRQILKREWTYIVDLDIEFIRWLNKKLNITTKTISSSEISTNSHDKQYRLIEICKVLDCDCFYEGESGRNYIDVELFKSQGIAVEFQRYQHPKYPQLWGEFVPYLSVIDLMFNNGPESLDYVIGRKGIIQ